MNGKTPTGISTTGLKRAAERGAKRSGLRAVLFFVFAIGAALTTAFVLTRYMEQRTSAARVPTLKVVVAAMDIPVATPLRVETLKVVDWPEASRPEKPISDPAPIVGRVAVTKILKGEPILEERLASSEAGSGLAALLPAGMRAAAVRVDDVVGVAGFIHPGDFVDVIVTMRPREEGQTPPVAKIILQGIKVLAVGKDVNQAGRADKPVTATVATLMVDSEQSEKLALAASKGQILLTLRSRVDLEEVDTEGMVPPVLLAGGLSVAATPQKTPSAAPRVAARPARRAEPAPKPAVTASPEEKQTVEILRGDLFEKRSFQKESRQ
jgi:pilus assembly protein CpaB